MRKEFFEQLEKELDAIEAPNKEEILNKYNKRYDFGLESEMSEDEIEAMLGNPKDIASSCKSTNALIVVDSGEKHSLNINTISDDIILKRSDDDKIHISFEETSKDKYKTFKVDSNGVCIDYSTLDYFKLNRSKGKIIISIPLNKMLDKVCLKSTHGKIESVDINASYVEVSSTSADVSLDNVVCDEFYSKLSTADMKVAMINAKNVKFKSVSGNVMVDTVIAEKIIVDTVSGDVTVEESNAKYKVVSLTGKVKIGELKPKNIKQKVKEVFVSEA